MDRVHVTGESTLSEPTRNALKKRVKQKSKDEHRVGDIPFKTTKKVGSPLPRRLERLERLENLPSSPVDQTYYQTVPSKGTSGRIETLQGTGTSKSDKDNGHVSIHDHFPLAPGSVPIDDEDMERGTTRKKTRGPEVVVSEMAGRIMPHRLTRVELHALEKMLGSTDDQEITDKRAFVDNINNVLLSSNARISTGNGTPWLLRVQRYLDRGRPREYIRLYSPRGKTSGRLGRINISIVEISPG
jgi:hypothetical protein